MDGVAGKSSILVWATHLSALALILLWIFPTVGLLVSSFRTADQISTTGWWASLTQQERQNPAIRITGDEIQQGEKFVITGNLFEGDATVSHWGWSSKRPTEFSPGDIAELSKGRTLQVNEDGSFIFTAPETQEGKRLPRVFTTATTPPEFTFDNYHNMLFNPKNVEGMKAAFFGTLTVTIPSTVIPVLVAAFAAYALAWMQFPFRMVILAMVIGLLVVPLQLSLIPLLRLHLEIGIGKGFVGVWLAHTGFGLPLAIFLLRNYMAGLPKDIIENARVDGATDFQIFTRIILPLSFPALAAFGILQFLWTWNDLLVAKVFLIDSSGQTNVMTNQIVELLGTRGGNWEILATAAFISMVVPLIVFLLMQRYLVRGLLSGSVK